MKKRTIGLRLLHCFVSISITLCVVYVSAFGVSFLPPLGSVLNPGNGIWTSTGNTWPLTQETLHFPGLHQPVTVVFEANGMLHISASRDDDLFWSIGYLQARFRLTQMDLLRRQGEGQLAEIFGPTALENDRFQVTLGLDRVAAAEWQAISHQNNDVSKNLLAFCAGVNARIAEVERAEALPLLFKLLNYQPKPWTPIDTLVVQGDITQELAFSTTPLHYALLVKSLGYQHTMQWFPVLPPDFQQPYDRTSHTNSSSNRPPGSSQIVPLPSQISLSQTNADYIASLDTFLQPRSAPFIQTGSASNNWAINGPKVADGKALMAGDPHLDLSLPAIWFQMEAKSPGYSFTGITIPGLPLIVMGHNQHISWSITDAQNASTLYYAEQTDAAHPFQYYWQGAWHTMQHLTYNIAVKGQSTTRQDVYLTVHGPVLPAVDSLPGQTISVAWTGTLPANQNNLEALINILHATNFTQFRTALRTWIAPTLNFVYADDQGNIGIIAPGYYPLVKSGAPWLPLPGTGEADIVGSIPYNDVPQSYNPPDHIVFSANQRPVNNDYPYYIGTTWDGFDNGYRANEIYAELSSKTQLDMQDMERIQNSAHDYLAALIVPAMLKILQPATLTKNEQDGLHLLASWNEDMDEQSPAASIWWTFWESYLRDTFQPWWQAAHVPTQAHPSLAISAKQASLDEMLEVWTLHDQNNPAFTSPGHARRDASQVMLQAYQDAIHLLEHALGDNPQAWAWGKIHTREISSLLQAQDLSYGPVASAGDNWTLNAAGASPKNTNSPFLSASIHGPSWRFIMDWGTNRAESIYPGGLDEDPTSPWYENLITPWLEGHYSPLIDGPDALKQPGSVAWTLDH